MAKVISVLSPTPYQRDRYLDKLFNDKKQCEILDVHRVSFFDVCKEFENLQYLQMFSNKKQAFLKVCKLYNNVIDELKSDTKNIVILTPSPFELGMMYTHIGLWTHKPVSMYDMEVKFDLYSCFYFAEHRGGHFVKSIDDEITSLDHKLRPYKTKLTQLLDRSIRYNINLVKITKEDKFEKFIKYLGKL